MNLGFMKSMDNRKRSSGDTDSCIFGRQAFGHAGAGGSIGIADLESRMSFSYTMNKMGAGILLNERGQSVVDAAYSSLGYTSNASGAWIDGVPSVFTVSLPDPGQPSAMA